MECGGKVPGAPRVRDGDTAFAPARDRLPPPTKSGVAGLRPLPPHSISRHPFCSVRSARRSEGGGCPPPPGTPRSSVARSWSARFSSPWSARLEPGVPGGHDVLESMAGRIGRRLRITTAMRPIVQRSRRRSRQPRRRRHETRGPFPGGTLRSTLSPLCWIPPGRHGTFTKS